MDCLKQNKLLPVNEYLLEMMKDVGQQSMNAFVKKSVKSSPTWLKPKTVGNDILEKLSPPPLEKDVNELTSIVSNKVEDVRPTLTIRRMVPPSTVKKDSSKMSVKNTLTDPEFVSNYLKSSRLHFIGTWKQKYKGRNQIIQPSVNKNLKHRFIAHIDMVYLYQVSNLERIASLQHVQCVIIQH